MPLTCKIGLNFYSRRYLPVASLMRAIELRAAVKLLKFNAAILTSKR
jgi:hypothetical protein